jgi:hypothetical protein
MTTYKFCIEIEVIDKDALAAAALHHLIYNDGMCYDEANEMIYPEGSGADPSVEACLTAILHPIESPLGTQLHGSFTE